MSILDYFKPVSTWPVAKVRDFLDKTAPGDYNLVDVRQPQEYQRGHLPGAQLIPVGDLEKRAKELDPHKPTITYWAAGVRSRAAAAILSRAGFQQVYSMEGGINAWDGFVAKGPPEAGLAYFEPGKKAEELVALAWVLEDGSQEFYSAASGMIKDRETVFFLQKLSADEENHKNVLFQIYRELSAMETDPGFPRSLIPLDPGVKYLEGGVPLTKALEWVKGKDPREILELCISLEINSEDLYLKMERKVEEKEAKRVFKVLAVQEKHHVERLVRLFEKK